jgi:hypothetical protein
LFWGALAAAIALAVTYLTCGKGWGLGGAGSGSGGGGSAQGIANLDAQPAQCELKLAPEGITIDGAKVTRDQAIERCKTSGRAIVTVTGNTVQAEWDELKTALEAANITVFRREPGK